MMIDLMHDMRPKAYTKRCCGTGLLCGVWLLCGLWVFGAAIKDACGEDSRAADAAVLAGVDRLAKDGFAVLAGQRVGLITNHTGVTREGIGTVQLLHDCDQLKLTTLFSPEHGFRGELDVSTIADSKDSQTGLIVHSLYGATRRPNAEMLREVDTLVFDIQDIGARFYTYVSTMGEAMKAASEHGKRFVVLDRPNPIGGVVVSGPMLDAGRESFVGFHSLPIRHGMTIGELALMFRSELNLDLELEIVRCEGWRRSMFWDQTGLPWVNPSPNMRSLTEAMLYPGIGMLETTNLSVGRGTDTPFEWIGAPWIDSLDLADRMRRQSLVGCVVIPRAMTPESSRYAGQRCGGVNLMITDRETFDPLVLGVALATSLRDLYPQQWTVHDSLRLVGNQSVVDALAAGASVEEVLKLSRRGVDTFKKRRSEFLLYSE